MIYETSAFFIILLVANAIQAITGFAGTLLAMPAAMMLIGVQQAKIVLNFIALASGLFIVFQNYRYIQLRELIKICIFHVGWFDNRNYSV